MVATALREASRWAHRYGLLEVMVEAHLDIPAMATTLVAVYLLTPASFIEVMRRW